ncbi:hypothetical protein XENTR_v10014413 [Xenopus tropicalis]|nr:hypothetical protein XENTR_v10014413 [Xenopus tropicalis]
MNPSTNHNENLLGLTKLLYIFSQRLTSSYWVQMLDLKKLFYDLNNFLVFLFSSNLLNDISGFYKIIKDFFCCQIDKCMSVRMPFLLALRVT